MKRTILLVAGLGLAGCALPTSAAPNVPLKCGANMERVWVYDNLTTLDVNVRLACGTPVDVVGLEKGYVKIRTADGTEGYVPGESVPSSELAELTAAAAPAPPATVAGAARANAQVMVVAQAAVPVSATSSVAATRVVAVTATAPGANPAPAIPSPVPPSAAAAPATPPAEQSKPMPAPVPVPAAAPAPAPKAPVTRVAVVNLAPSSRVTPASTQRPAVVAPAAPVAAAESVPEVTIVAVAAPAPQKPAASVSAPVRVSPAPEVRPAEPEDATLTVEETREPMTVVMTAPEPTATVVRAAEITPVTKRSPLAAAVREAGYSDDDENTPDLSAARAQDLAACNVYFSAYGVTPMQQKWIADERRKRFPGVCPAPEPAMVDYVVIFTHDMDFFTTTLPDPIHTDRNGFSDWSPVTATDDTMIPVSSLDKAHHEYAWVFRVHRGTYDPSKFTSKRRPQFTKTESSSHASSKSIEDAMEFISQTGASQ